MPLVKTKMRKEVRQILARAVRPIIEPCEPRILLAFSAVPTFECVGLYWSPTGGGSSVQATVKYKVTGTTTWKNGQDLWFALAEDVRPAEYRGSIVGLKSGTTYDLQVALAGGAAENYQVTTWSEDFPIAQTIVVGNRTTPLEINNVHGSASGYILYTGPGTIDGGNTQPYCIRIQSSDYIIIRGLTLTGPTGDGILLGSSTGSNSNSVHDIVIENNDISNWGSVDTADPTCLANGWGYDDQAGVRSSSSNLERIIVQRNKIHDPRPDTNSWKEYNPTISSYHPNGPQGITFEYGTKGNFVIRYNEINGSPDHRFNDTMGSDNNYGYGGFPVKDSDIYGNYLTYTWDDGMEIEGADMNVRVWGNLTDYTYTGVAMSGVSMGPLYIFRNVFMHSQTGMSPYSSYGGVAFKRGGGGGIPSDGRIYIYNNTMYYAGSPTFQTGLSERTDADFSTNTIMRNNILHVRNTTDKSIYNRDVNSSSDYDLYNGVLTTVNPVDETHGIKGVESYVSGAGFITTTKKGTFQLKSTSLGYDGGVVIPNFTDGYAGAAPDIGAHEAGAAAMEFGVNANDPVAPAAVTDLVAKNPTAVSVTLEWTAVGDDGTTGTARVYDIRYATSPITEATWNAATVVTGEPYPAPPGTKQSMVVTGLVMGQLYYFAIKTADKVNNWAALSNVVSATTISDAVAPAGVTNLTATIPTNISVTLQWMAPGDDGNTGTATAYEIRYATTAITDANWTSATVITGVPTPAVAGANQSMTVTGLNASVKYYFALKTVDEVGNWSVLSNVASVTTTADTTPPATVIDLSVGNPSTTSLTVSWTAPGDDGDIGTATTYDLRYATTPITDANWASATAVSGEPTPAVAGTVESMTVTGLVSGTTYYFALKTRDEVGNESLLSNVANGVTLGSGVIKWVGPASENWTTTTNWQGGNVPDTVDESAWIDGNNGQSTSVTYTMVSGTSLSINSLTVDAGDTLTIKPTSNTSNSVTINGALTNAGTINWGSWSVSNTGSYSFTVTVGGSGGTFNSVSGVMYLDSSTSYRRSLATYNIPSNNINAGTIYVRNRSSQGGCKVRLMLTGSGSQTFTNNGTIQVQGLATDGSTGTGYTPSALVGPATAGEVLTLAGSGELMLLSCLTTGDRLDSYAMLAGLASGTSLINGATHTIMGNGYIGATSPNGGASGDTISLYAFSSFTNNGLIQAAASDPTNWTTPSLFISSPLTNAAGGRMVALNAQILNVNGASFTNNGLIEARAEGNVTLAATTQTLNGELRGAGSYTAGTLTMSGTGAMSPGDSVNDNATGASTAGVLTVNGNLTLANTTALNFQLGGTTTRGKDYDGVDVSGNLVLDGVLNVTALPGFGTGTYRLFNFAPGTLTNNVLSLGTMPTGFSYNLKIDNTNGTVDLVVTNAGPPQWISSTTGIWTDTANWNGTVPNAIGATAVLDGFGKGTVSISTGVTVGSLTIDNSSAYMISGGTLTVNNSTTPASISVLSGSHTITSSLVLNSNVVINVAAGAQLTLSGAITANNFTLKKTGDGVLNLGNQTFTVGNAVTFAGGTVENGTLVNNSAFAYEVQSGSVSAILTGTVGLVKTTTGIATLSGGNTYSGGTTVSAGELRVIKIPGTSLTLNGGKLVVTAKGGHDAANLIVLKNLSVLPATGTGSTNQLDLGTNDLLLRSGVTSSIADISRALAGAIYVDSTYKTTGILSADDWRNLNGQSFDGTTISGNDIVLMYTLAGDATLDGRITMDDYLQIDTGYLFDMNGWANGDFNHDGLVNADDYLLIDHNNVALNDALAQDTVALHAAMFGENYNEKLAATFPPPPPPTTPSTPPTDSTTTPTTPTVPTVPTTPTIPTTPTTPSKPTKPLVPPPFEGIVDEFLPPMKKSFPQKLQNFLANLPRFNKGRII